MRLKVELEEEEDGRWIAEVPELPGVLAYGSSKAEAHRVQALALRVVAERLREPLAQHAGVVGAGSAGTYRLAHQATDRIA